MKQALATIAVMVIVLGGYLLLWPVPVDPVAWQAPTDQGLVDPFEKNRLLERLRAIDMGEHHGPEDIAVGHDGNLYATSSSGTVVRIDSNRKVTEFADVGGHPLGLEIDADGSFVVANAYLGLQRILRDGSVIALLDEVDGNPLVYADDLAIADDGTVYFSQASTKFGAEQYGGTYPAALLDILEHGGHGQIIEFKPASGAARIIIDNLNFANGVAISDDQNYLLIAETGSYRILKHWLRGPNTGSTEVLLDNLPALPDNINNGMHGRFWIGMAAPRISQLDELSGKAFVRKMVQRLPAEFRPKAQPYSHILAINGDGEVLMNMHDPYARYPTLTGALETPTALYLSTLFGNQLPWLDKAEMFD